jgi:hypothetical protein
MPERIRSKTPGTLRDALSFNVRQQQRRSAATASPPEAKRPPRERIKDAQKKAARKKAR